MKLAIFGCGRIANRIAKSCLMVKEIDLVGFGSKDIDKAKEYSEKYGCREYGDYDHFLNSDIDAVYIAVYNPGHYDLIRKCLEHKKNVICEKPMLFSLKENEEMFALAKENDVLLMEALKSVFLPLNIRIRKMMEDKVLGETKEIYTAFMRNGSHGEDHWINDPKCGGALSDLGSYCIGTMNFLTGIEPVLVSCESDRTEEKADSTAYVTVDYDGIIGKASVSNRLDGDTTLIVTGERGFIRADNYWKSGDAYYELDGVRYEIHEELISDFYYELKHFADLTDQGKKESDVMSKEASDRILKITQQR
jgi:predicted dehydrogenase